MTQSIFRKATRANFKLRLALIGPPGSGKTMSALRILRGMGAKKIAVIDTENASSELYADLTLEDAKAWGPLDFCVAPMSPPYSVDKYLRAINDAVAEGFDAIVVDSLSHAWAGEGGILNKKEQMDARGGTSFNNWAKLTPEQERLKSAILQNKVHLVCTMRSKVEYLIEQNEKGKSAPKKVGLAPVQREGMEYEFDLVLNIAEDHSAEAGKDRTHKFPKGHFFTPTEETGKALSEWLATGPVREVPPPPPEPAPRAPETAEEARALKAAQGKPTNDSSAPSEKPKSTPGMAGGTSDPKASATGSAPTSTPVPPAGPARPGDAPENEPPPEPTLERVDVKNMHRAEIATAILNAATFAGWNAKKLEAHSDRTYKKKLLNLTDDEMRDLYEHVFLQGGAR